MIKLSSMFLSRSKYMKKVEFLKDFLHGPYPTVRLNELKASVLHSSAFLTAPFGTGAAVYFLEECWQRDVIVQAL